MTAMRKRSEKHPSLAGGLAIGSTISLAITLIGCGILAKLIETETLSETAVGYGALMVILLASWLGSGASCRKIGRKRLMISACTGGIYSMILLSIHALFFEGPYVGIGATILLILCGNLLTVLAGMKNGRGGKHSKIKITNR